MPDFEIPVVSTGLDRETILFSAKDALRPRPPLQWCVDGLFPLASLSMLVGASGSKKTFLAIDLAACVALGVPWLGRPVLQGPVLFIDEQTGPRTLLSRCNAALLARGAGPETPVHLTSMGGFSLREKDSAEAVMQLAESINPSLIVIDGFTNLLQGVNESSLGAVLPALFNLRLLAEFNDAAVLVTHHTNRHGFFQGSAAIASAMDLILAIQSAPADPLIQVQPVKSRSVAPAPFAAAAHFDTAEDGTLRFHLTATDQQSASPKEPIKIPAGVTGLAYTLWSNDFLSHDQFTFKDLRSRHAGDSRGSIRNAIQQLLKERIIRRADDGGQGKEALYNLARPP